MDHTGIVRLDNTSVWVCQPCLQYVCICAVKLLLCFTRRIENNKAKKIKTKPNALNKRATVIALVNALALQTRFKRVRNAFMMFACLRVRVVLSCVSVVPYTSFNYGGLNNISYLAKTNCQSYTLQLTTRQILNL